MAIFAMSMESMGFQMYFLLEEEFLVTSDCPVGFYDNMHLASISWVNDRNRPTWATLEAISLL